MQRSEKHERIQIALHGAVMPDHGPSFIQMDPPVEADDVPAGFAHLPENGGRPVPK